MTPRLEGRGACDGANTSLVYHYRQHGTKALSEDSRAQHKEAMCTSGRLRLPAIRTMNLLHRQRP